MTIYIKTNQNVNIEYEICSLFRRIGAFLIDLLIITGIILAFVLITSLILTDKDNLIIFLFVGLPIFFYHLICELTMNGQSVGKRATSIKVIKADGSQASFSNYFIRFLLRPIDTFYFIGLVFVFFTKKNQRIGDLAANTIVINVKDVVSLADITKTMHASKSDIVYPEAEKLNDKDIKIIKSVLERRKGEPLHENVVILSNKMQDYLQVTTNKPPYIFLTTLVKDYNAMYS